MKTEIDSLDMSYNQLREFETLLRRTLLLVERSTGDADLRRGIMVIEHAITTVRMLQFAIMGFESATGPLGIAVALSSLAMTGYMASQTISSYDALRGTS